MTHSKKFLLSALCITSAAFAAETQLLESGARGIIVPPQRRVADIAGDFNKPDTLPVVPRATVAAATAAQRERSGSGSGSGEDASGTEGDS